MLCVSGPCPCKLALPTKGSNWEVAGTQTIVAWEARAAQGGGVAVKRNKLAAGRERCLSTRKSLNNWSTVSLDPDW